MLAWLTFSFTLTSSLQECSTATTVAPSTSRSSLRCGSTSLIGRTASEATTATTRGPSTGMSWKLPSRRSVRLSLLLIERVLLQLMCFRLPTLRPVLRTHDQEVRPTRQRHGRVRRLHSSLRHSARKWRHLQLPVNFDLWWEHFVVSDADAVVPSVRHRPGRLDQHQLRSFPYTRLQFKSLARLARSRNKGRFYSRLVTILNAIFLHSSLPSCCCSDFSSTNLISFRFIGTRSSVFFFFAILCVLTLEMMRYSFCVFICK